MKPGQSKEPLGGGYLSPALLGVIALKMEPLHHDVVHLTGSLCSSLMPGQGSACWEGPLEGARDVAFALLGYRRQAGAGQL